MQVSTIPLNSAGLKVKLIYKKGNIGKEIYPTLSDIQNWLVKITLIVIVLAQYIK